MTENDVADYECLRNWYNKYDKMRSVVELYEDSYNFPRISVEMLFLNLVQALEIYHARFVSDDLKQYIRLVDNFLREPYELEKDAEWADFFCNAVISYYETSMKESYGLSGIR